VNLGREVKIRGGGGREGGRPGQSVKNSDKPGSWVGNTILDRKKGKKKKEKTSRKPYQKGLVNRKKIRGWKDTHQVLAAFQ